MSGLGLDRGRRAGRFLEWKVRLFVAGAVLALAGMYLESTWMVSGAIVVLVAGFGLRFLPGGRLRGDPEETDAVQDPSDGGPPSPGE